MVAEVGPQLWLQYHGNIVHHIMVAVVGLYCYSDGIGIILWWQKWDHNYSGSVMVHYYGGSGGIKLLW